MKTNIKKNLPVIIVAVIAVILFASIVTYKRTKENNAWELATKMNSSTSYEDYLKSYPIGKYKIKADRLYDQSLWTETVKVSYFEAYQSYLNKIPNGFHIAEAKKILEKSKELPLLKGRLIEKKDLIIFLNHQRFLVVGSTKKINKETTKVQTIIYKCDINKIKTGENIWKLIWKTKDVEAFRYESLYVLKTNNSALILSGYNNGGAYGLSSFFVLRLNLNGKVEKDNNLEYLRSENVVIKDNSIVATEDLRRTEYIVIGDEITQKIIVRSDMAHEGAIKVYFHLNEDGEISPSSNNLLNLKIGQTIAFIPDNEKTKIAFNKGDIGIFTDNWHVDGSAISTCEADRVRSGNDFKLDKIGECHFLVFNEQNPNISYSTVIEPEYQPTFTVLVSKPITQSENRIQSVQNTQSTSNSRTVTNTQSSTSGGYRRSNRDYFAGESAVHEFLSRHSFVSNDGSRLSYSIGDLTITYNRGRLRFTNIEVRIYNQDVAVVSATDIGSGRTLRIKLNATYGSIVDMNDNSMSFQAVN